MLIVQIDSAICRRLLPELADAPIGLPRQCPTSLRFCAQHTTFPPSLSRFRRTDLSMNGSLGHSVLSYVLYVFDIT